MAETYNKPTPTSNHVANHRCNLLCGLEGDGAPKETLLKTNIKLIPIQSVLPHISMILLLNYADFVPGSHLNDRDMGRHDNEPQF